jgi:hypothetical protein
MESQKASVMGPDFVHFADCTIAGRIESTEPVGFALNEGI